MIKKNIINYKITLKNGLKLNKNIFIQYFLG